MTTKQINSTIARLDRIAKRIGLDLDSPSTNRREFETMGKRYVYKPAGKGTVRVEVRESGKTEAVVICNVDRVSALMMLATEVRS